MTEQTPKVNPRPGFLAGVVAEKRAEVAAARRARPLAELQARARDRPPARSLEAAIRAPGCGVIAEVKRASPSAGLIAPDVVARDRARLYEEAGAIAISVLTDRRFAGAIEDLVQTTDVVALPVLRKDFLVDPWQIWESRAAGADAALLVVAAMDRGELQALAAEAAEAGLELLVEIHAAEEGERALDLEVPVLGVNARDLSTLEVDLAVALATLRDLRRIAPHRALVAESGIAAATDVEAARAAGADAVLVGEHLARATDPAAALARLVAAGRTEA